MYFDQFDLFLYFFIFSLVFTKDLGHRLTVFAKFGRSKNPDFPPVCYDVSANFKKVLDFSLALKLTKFEKPFYRLKRKA